MSPGSRVIRLVALDVDGTLMMEDDQIISPTVQHAIAAAQERGTVVTLAMGRTFASAVPFARDLEHLVLAIEREAS